MGNGLNLLSIREDKQVFGSEPGRLGGGKRLCSGYVAMANGDDYTGM